MGGGAHMFTSYRRRHLSHAMGVCFPPSTRQIQTLYVQQLTDRSVFTGSPVHQHHDESEGKVTVTVVFE